MKSFFLTQRRRGAKEDFLSCMKNLVKKAFLDKECGFNKIQNLTPNLTKERGDFDASERLGFLQGYCIKFLCRQKFTKS